MELSGRRNLENKSRHGPAQGASTPDKTFFTGDDDGKSMDRSEVIRPAKGGVELEIMVTPNARSAAVGEVDPWRKRLVIKVQALPTEGRANKAVVELLSDFFDTKAEIVRGHTDRQKTVFLPVSMDAAVSRLEGK